MKKILVTGAGGFLGNKLVELLNELEEVEVIPTSRNTNSLSDAWKDLAYDHLDITDSSEVSAIFDKYQPDVVINTAAMSGVDACEESKAECWKVNTEALQSLSAKANQFGTHLIHLSSDFVFDGEQGPYSEKDITNPLSHYGYSKLSGEKVVSETANKWTIIRTILVYGIPSVPGRSNILLWVKDKLQHKQAIQVVQDQYRMPTLVDDLAQTCLFAALEQKTGLYHVSGNQMLSILEMAHKIPDFYNLDSSLISPVFSSQLNEKARRPYKTGFILDKAIQYLNMPLRSFDDGLKYLEAYPLV